MLCSFQDPLAGEAAGKGSRSLPPPSPPSALRGSEGGAAAMRREALRREGPEVLLRGSGPKRKGEAIDMNKNNNHN